MSKSQVVPAEILKKVKRVEIDTRKLVNNLFSGEYHTHFKGQGMTFADFREYIPGDDVRAISWSLMARAGKPFIKTFEEERELTLILAVDVSGSQNFGSHGQFKGEVLTYVAATLAFSAVKNNDRVGLVLFTNEVELYVPPKKGKAHVYRLLRELLFYKPQSQKTNISAAMDYLSGVLKKRSTIFVLSDFRDTNYHLSMNRLEKKHEVIAGLVADEAEFVFPDLGLIDLQDPETGEMILIDSSDAQFRSFMQAQFKSDFEKFEKNLKKSGVESFQLATHQDYHRSLMAFFKRRGGRKK